MSNGTVTFTHNNFKNNVEIYPDMIFAIMVLPENKTTAIVGNGGAMVPVTASPEEAKALINAAKSGQRKEV